MSRLCYPTRRLPLMTRRNCIRWSNSAIALIVFLISRPSLGAEEQPGIESKALQTTSTRSAANSSTLFEKVGAATAGIDFQHTLKLPEKYALHLTSYAVTVGVAVGDYDGDGRPDIFLANTTDGGSLYRNLGNFRFENATSSAKLDLKDMWTTGVTFADINNDGHLDLYLCGFQCPNRLYVNQGDGTFVERAKALGLDYSGASTMMSFADIDRDGDLDGYLLTNSTTHYGTPTIKGKGQIIDGRVVLPKEYEESAYVAYLSNGQFRIVSGGEFDYLYRNEDGQSFTDISSEAGIRGPNHQGLSATWWDYNGDLWPDLYVANDFYGPDHLYVHNGDRANPAFDNQTKNALPYTPWFSMGADYGDINNDGLLDFMGADMAESSHYRSKVTMGDMSSDSWFLDYADPQQYMRNMLYVNTGRNSFMEVGQMAGVSSTNWTWTIRVADLDCDGLQDVFVTSGMTRDYGNADLKKEIEQIEADSSSDDSHDAVIHARAEFWLNQPVLAQPNFAFHNQGDLKFNNAASEWGLDESKVSFGAATGDFDGDGDLDLVVNNFEGPPSIYRNHTKASANRVSIQLRGVQSNSSGIGATIELTTHAGKQIRYLTLARGYLSSSEPKAFFGLGDDQRIEKLSVRWPSGHIQEFNNLDANRAYSVTEPTAPAPPFRSEAEPETLLSEVPIPDDIRHAETPFDDFALQPLLPNRLSQFGPGLAWGDLNGDGRDDLFLSGAAGSAGQIAFNRPNGLELSPAQDCLTLDAPREDMASLIFDADGDGDNDLFVVSGGVEAKASSGRLRDRLYLNDGNGNFDFAPDDSLPDLRDSGSTAVAADYDRDGDLDLFVGGRLIPGDYPSTPGSCLLRNDSPSSSRALFTDVTDSDAEGLRTTGLVTGAIWSDTNDDGWIDLVVVHEWGPIKIFRNHNGKLVDETDEAGLADRQGWYNGIAAGDVDRDGDMDFVVTNFGRNTKYHPKLDKPAHLYYGDFDESGNKQIVEAAVKNDGLLPVRGKSCSQNAMPFLREKYPTYHSFASQLLPDIYTPSCLEESLHLTANDLDSVILINQGDGTFVFRALPAIAHVAPSYGAALIDLDADGNLDLAIGQNFFGPQRETGRMSGGVGAILRGDGEGNFKPLWPNESGFVVREDATALTVTDLDADNAPELVIATNNGPLRAFTLSSQINSRFITIQLQGLAGNPLAVGARITITFDDQSTQTMEMTAGGSYLSQSSAIRFVAVPKGKTIESVNIRWPDGSRSELGDVNSKSLLFTQPE